MKTYQEALRWIAVLPVAIIGYLVPVWGNYYVVTTLFSIENGFVEICFGIVISFIGGGCFVVFGTKCSPRKFYRTVVSVILALVLTFITAILFVAVFQMISDNTERLYYQISFVCAFIGGVIGCISESKDFICYLKTREYHEFIDNELDKLKR